MTSGSAEVSFRCSVVLRLETMSCVGVGVCVIKLLDLSRQRALEDFSLLVEIRDGTFNDIQADFWLPLNAPHESSSVSETKFHWTH